jgi:uncharacterized membrane protein
MLSLRLLGLFIHIVAVIVALGGSLFSTFALAPELAAELDPPTRLRVSRRIVRRRAALKDAQPMSDNAYKIVIAKVIVRRAIMHAAGLEAA